MASTIQIEEHHFLTLAALFWGLRGGWGGPVSVDPGWFFNPLSLFPLTATHLCIVQFNLEYSFSLADDYIGSFSV